MAIGIHDPTDYSCLFDTITLDGFGDGDGITLEAPTEQVLAKRGVNGEYAIALKRDRLHSLKVNLHQTASMNATLRAKHAAQFRAGWAPYPCSLKNKRTGEVWRGKAWITTPPGTKVGEAVQNLEWDIGFYVESLPGENG